MIEWGEIGIISSIQDYDPSRGTNFLTFAAHRIQTELRDFLHSIRLAYMENYYPDDEDEEGEWAGEEFCFRSNPELRPLEKMFLNERRDLLLDASMEALPEQERKYIEYRCGFITGKPMSRSEIAKILDVPESEAKRIEEDALEYFRDCFHVARVNAFYELRPEAEIQKALAQESQEALFDNCVGIHVDMLLAQFEEDERSPSSRAAIFSCLSTAIYNRAASEISVLPRTRTVRRGLGQEPPTSKKTTRFP